MDYVMKMLCALKIEVSEEQEDGTRSKTERAELHSLSVDIVGMFCDRIVLVISGIGKLHPARVRDIGFEEACGKFIGQSK